MLENSRSRNKVGLFSGLVLLMVLTRTHHFGSVSLLPDASLAIFFFAGMYLRRWFVFPFFIALAGLLDYSVINLGGVSSWCVTPGYAFLIPTYAVMWEAGRYCSKLEKSTIPGSLKVLVSVFIATIVAFVISNYGFYAFSERFESLSLISYFSTVAKYLPDYLLTTILYSAVFLSVHGFIDAISGRHKLSH